MVTSTFFLSCIIVFLLRSLEIANAHCWDKLFYYKLPNYSDKCEICRICPDVVLNSPDLYKKHLQDLCVNTPVLSGGRLARCHSTDFSPPACEKLQPERGRFICSNDNIIYSTCQLQCPAGYLLPRVQNVTCTTDDGVKWDRETPKCLVDETWHSDRIKRICGYVVLATVILLCFATTVYCLHRNRKRLGNCMLGNCMQKLYHRCPIQTSKTVTVTLTGTTKRCHTMLKWIAQIGSTVTVLGKCNESEIKSFVLLKLKREDNLESVHSSTSNAPCIRLENVTTEHQGRYIWIANLEDGKCEKGEFKLVVKRNWLRKSTTGRVASENEKLESVDTPAILTNGAVGEADVTLPLASTAKQTAANNNWSNCKSLKLSLSDHRTLCTLWDQEECQGQVTWHVVAKSLLIYDQDTINFLEYHLKGKLYRGPTSYILTLMLQHGIGADQVLEFLEPYRPSSEKDIEIFLKYAKVGDSLDPLLAGSKQMCSV